MLSTVIADPFPTFAQRFPRDDDFFIFRMTVKPAKTYKQKLFVYFTAQVGCGTRADWHFLRR